MSDHDELDQLDEIFGGSSELEEEVTNKVEESSSLHIGSGPMDTIDTMESMDAMEVEPAKSDVEMKSAAEDEEEDLERKRQLNLDIFGEGSSSSSSSSDEKQVKTPPKRERSKNVLGKKEVSLGPCSKLSDQHLTPYLLKLPGFIAVEEEEYTRERLEVEEIALMEVDEAGNYPKDGLLRLASSLRWRQNYMTEAMESNGRIIRWSDGSLSLAIGSEQFEVMAQGMQKENSYLAVSHPSDGYLEAVGRVGERLAIRPFVTADQSHRKYLAISTAAVQSTAHPSGREAAKVKMAVTTADPDREKQRMIKLEQDKIKSKRKVEARRRNLQARSYERVARTGLSAKFLEEDEHHEGEDEDRYEDDFIDDTENVAGSEEGEDEGSEEDTDYRTDDGEEESEEAGSESDESTAQESDAASSEESVDGRKKKKTPSPGKSTLRKAAKIADSDDE